MATWKIHVEQISKQSILHDLKENFAPLVIYGNNEALTAVQINATTFVLHGLQE